MAVNNWGIIDEPRVWSLCGVETPAWGTYSEGKTHTPLAPHVDAMSSRAVLKLGGYPNPSIGSGDQYQESGV